MQTNMTVHDTDQKQGNTMNTNPKRGNRREERTMKMRTIQMCIAVIAVLALACNAMAADSRPVPPPVELDKLAGKPAPGGGEWKKVDVVIEWGFKQGTEAQPFDGSVDVTQTGHIGKPAPLAEGAAEMVDDRSWKSPPRGNSRRGIRLPVFYTPASRGSDRTIVTIRTSAGSFSFLPLDLESGPILVPDQGFFLCDPSPRPVAPPVVHLVLPDSDLMKGKYESEWPESRGWGSKDAPLLTVNPTDKDLVKGAIRLPAHGVLVHPSGDRDVAVGWRSPIEGKVSITTMVKHGLSGGDGVTWAIVHDRPRGRTVLTQGVVKPASNLILAAQDADRLSAVSVARGDAILLVIGCRGGHSSDVTLIELTITETAGARNVWSLAKDAVPDIQAGNPHADAQGSPAVWHFLSPMRVNPFAEGPALLPVAFRSSATTARDYLAELATHNLKTIRQRVREMPEQSWEAAMRALHGDIKFPPLPVPQIEPAMSVEVPDKYLTGMWRDGAWGIIRYCPRIRRMDVRNIPLVHTYMNQIPKVARLVPDPKDPSGMYIVGCNPFSPIAAETDRIIWALEHLGMHEVSQDGISLWLENQQPDGMLNLGPGITNDGVHEFGAFHVLWNVVEHYRFTGDKQWLARQLPRLKLAAKWIIDRRNATKRETLTPQEIEGIRRGILVPNGLQTAISGGDGGSGSRGGWWINNSTAYESLRVLADVIGDVDPKAAAEYATECENYKKDILKVLNECIALSPVIRVSDGTYRSFHPPCFDVRGPLAFASPPKANIYSHCGLFSSDIVISSAAIESWLRSGLLAIDDPRIDGHFEVLEDRFLRDNPWVRKRSPEYDPARDWFGKAGWGYQSGWERLPDYYLLADDVPNFLRSWLNRCAVDINFSNWSFNEHTTFAANDKSHGRAVFLTNFRNMLVMEIGDALWLARATPRAWLEQGKKISVKNSPTYFGTVAYEIVSDVDNSKITATVELPARKAPKEVVLRFRHPKSAPIKGVTVNGKPWTEFNKDKETITLKGLTGQVAVTAQY